MQIIFLIAAIFLVAGMLIENPIEETNQDLELSKTYQAKETTLELSNITTTQRQVPEIISLQETTGFAIEHHSQPTTLGLQGKVSDSNGNPLTDGNIGVKVSDTNSCTSQVFYDVNFNGAIDSNGYFNILLGETIVLSLNFNQDYYSCIYVNGELLTEAQKFRGGQGQISGEDVNDTIDVNNVIIDKNLTVANIVPLTTGDTNTGDENGASWPVDRNYRKKLSFSASDINENLTNFPILVKLSASNFDFEKDTNRRRRLTIYRSRRQSSLATLF